MIWNICITLVDRELDFYNSLYAHISCSSDVFPCSLFQGPSLSQNVKRKIWWLEKELQMVALVHSIARIRRWYNSLGIEISLIQVNTHILSAEWSKISIFFVTDPNYSAFFFFFWIKRMLLLKDKCSQRRVSFLKGSFCSQLSWAECYADALLCLQHMFRLGFHTLSWYHLLVAFLSPIPSAVCPSFPSLSLSFLSHLPWCRAR